MPEHWAGHCYARGYADNHPNGEEQCKLKIDWANRTILERILQKLVLYLTPPPKVVVPKYKMALKSTQTKLCAIAHSLIGHEILSLKITVF